MKRKNKKGKVILMLALILCMTVGYAILTATLNITGNSEIKSAKWDIHFDNLVVDSSSVQATTPATIDSNKTVVNYGVNLAKPGDTYSFTVDVVNEGTIDGMISTVTNTGLTEEQQKYVEYVATYTNGNELKAKNALVAGSKRGIKVSVKYKDDVNPEDLPKEEKVISLTFKIDYIQADATVVPTSVIKSYNGGSNGDYHDNTYRSKVTKIVTKTNIDVPEAAIEHWDVSAAGDGSVVAYVEDDGSGNGTYSVTIGGDGEKVFANENSIWLFGSFSALKEVDLSNLDTSNVTNMSMMFQGCTSLTNLNLSNFDTSNVTNMDAMFRGCSSLTSLDLSNFDTGKVTSMGSMFYSCGKLTSLDLSNFDTNKVTYMNSMFEYCDKLASLNLNGFDFSKLIGFTIDGVNDGKNLVSYLSIPVKLETLSLDNTKIGTNVTSFKEMFQGKTSLKSISLVNMDASSVTSMYSMFSGCTNLTSINLDGFDSSNVTTMSGMFASCSSLKDLNLSNFDTNKVADMSGMFVNCSSLTSLDLSNFDTSNVTNMVQMFAGCSKLSTFIFITTKNSATISYFGMFYGAATEPGSRIIISCPCYSSDLDHLVSRMIETKSSNSNVSLPAGGQC